MKTTEVNKELVGRRCECMCLGSMVTGVIEDITVTKYTAEVKVRYDEPQRWGNEVLHSGWAHGDKDDESGSLKYLRLLPEPVRPDYETLIVTFARKDNSLRINRLVGLLENWVTRWQPFVFLSSSLLCSYVITLDTAKVIELFDTSNVVP